MTGETRIRAAGRAREVHVTRALDQDNPHPNKGCEAPVIDAARCRWRHPATKGRSMVRACECPLNLPGAQ